VRERAGLDETDLFQIDGRAPATLQLAELGLLAPSLLLALLLLLLRRECVELGEARVRLGQRVREQRAPAAREPLDGHRLEEVCAVTAESRDAALRLRQEKSEVEFGAGEIGRAHV